MSKLPMDLSKFQKIASDDKTSTFRHHEGHEIKIAHHKLSAKMREQLEKLPMATSKKMAQGGPVQRYAEGTDAVEPAPSPDVAPDQSLPPSAPVGGQSTLPDPSGPEPLPSDGTSLPEPEAKPVPLTPQGYKAAVADDIQKEGDAFGNDLFSGQITPHTYGQLFGKKDTAGKIGTIFGLLMSGAGSGLAHQSNAALDMMKKELDNDFEAQKASASNAQNFYRLNQANELNKSNVKALDAATDIKTQANGRINTNWAGFHKVIDLAKKFPPGSKQAIDAQNAIATMMPAMNAENSDIRDRAAGQMMLLNYGKGNQQQNPQQAPQTKSVEPSGNQGYTDNGGARVYPILAPDAVQNSIGATQNPLIDKSKLQSQITSADQIDKVINGPDKNGVGGIHQLLQDMYEDIGKGSQGASLEQRIKGAAQHLPYIGDIGEKGLNAVYTGQGYKDYASRRTGMIQDLSTALQGMIAPTDITKLVDDNMPIHGDTPEDVDMKEQQIINGIRKAMKTDELSKAGLLPSGRK